MTAPPFITELHNVSQRYRKITALHNVSLSIPSGIMAGLIGPDGAGKSTLMGLIAGARKMQQGDIRVLDGDMRQEAHRNAIFPLIAYMPQGLGKNLYMELTVLENLQFFARLFGLAGSERQQRIEHLLQATGLAPFSQRPAGKLSGGMKQKLGLCCALIHDPQLLILDEPTTGVDPLSRQQFWTLIDNIRHSNPRMSVLVSTAYMDEASRFDWLVAMNNGQVLAQGTPQALLQQTGSDSLETAFIRLLPEQQQGNAHIAVPPPLSGQRDIVISAQHLSKRFADFVAVDDVNFEINRGEIFGFLGSNGCGKTTTMKMLTGLLPASEGQAILFGAPVNTDSMATRRRVGYMSQAFSLYGELTVRQNLELHGRLFDLEKSRMQQRIQALISRFSLSRHLDDMADSLPLGVRQRLSLAVAVIHEPDMLILDEPTSGVDPVARNEFWELLIDLSRQQGVTIFISTHFMNEALRCDRISLMHRGRVLACDSPANIMAAKNTDDFEQAFIDYIRDEMDEEDTQTQTAPSEPLQHRQRAAFSLNRLLAYSYREYLEIIRDPIRLFFAFAGSVILYIVFGFGISSDVNNLRYATLDMDDSPESRAYTEPLRSSPYFREVKTLNDAADIDTLLRSHEVSLVIEIPPDFGRYLQQGKVPEVAAWIDGAIPDQAETIRRYVQGMHQTYLDDYSRRHSGQPLPQLPVNIVSRFSYNPAFESIFAMVPSIPAILLFTIPAVLMTVSIVREKELGSINNFYVTPVSRIEFLLGKQLPYILICFINALLLLAMAVFLFAVPLKGSLAAIVFGNLAYVFVTTGFGLMVSAFTRSQIAAIFATTLLAVTPTIMFSGIFQPVSTLEGRAQLIGSLWPAGYYMQISLGAFAKGLSFSELLMPLLQLCLYIPLFSGFAILAMKKQEA